MGSWWGPGVVGTPLLMMWGRNKKRGEMEEEDRKEGDEILIGFLKSLCDLLDKHNASISVDWNDDLGSVFLYVNFWTEKRMGICELIRRDEPGWQMLESHHIREILPKK